MANGNVAMTIRDGRIVSVYDKAHECVGSSEMSHSGDVKLIVPQKGADPRGHDWWHGHHGRPSQLLGVSSGSVTPR